MDGNPFRPDQPPLTGFPVVLRRERVRRGLKQSILARRLGCDPGTISRWERGERVPRIDHQQQLCQIFSMSIEALGLAGLEVTPAGTLVVAAPITRTEETEDVDRRDFLKYCGVVGATALAGGNDQLGHALGGPHQERLLEDLLALTRSYAEQWGTTSPTVLLPAVRTHLGVLQGLSAFAVSPSLALRLRSVTSETATVAGWLSVLLQNVGDGRAYYGFARDLAREAGDGPRVALALGAPPVRPTRPSPAPARVATRPSLSISSRRRRSLPATRSPRRW